MITFPPVEEFRGWLKSLPADQVFDSGIGPAWNCRCPVSLFLQSRGVTNARVGRFLAWCGHYRNETPIPKPYHDLIGIADGLRLFTVAVYIAFLEKYHD